MSAFYCYLSCCHVIFYCLTRDTEDSYTAMRMTSTTDSRILEMAIVGQHMPRLNATEAKETAGSCQCFNWKLVIQPKPRLLFLKT